MPAQLLPLRLGLLHCWHLCHLRPAMVQPVQRPPPPLGASVGWRGLGWPGRGGRLPRKAPSPPAVPQGTLFSRKGGLELLVSEIS